MKIGNWFDSSLLCCKIEDWLDRLVVSGVIPKESVYINEKIKQRWISWHYQKLGKQIFENAEKIVLCNVNGLVRYFCNAVVFNKERLRDIEVLLDYGLYTDIGSVMSEKFGKHLSYSGVEKIKLGDDITIEESRVWRVGEYRILSKIEVWKGGNRIEAMKEIGLTKDKVYTEKYVIDRNGRIQGNIGRKIRGVRLIG